MSENNTKDLELLKEKISRLMAANRELNQNIAVMQALEEENEELKKKLREYKYGI